MVPGHPMTLLRNDVLNASWGWDCDGLWFSGWNTEIRMGNGGWKVLEQVRFGLVTGRLSSSDLFLFIRTVLRLAFFQRHRAVCLSHHTLLLTWLCSQVEYRLPVWSFGISRNASPQNALFSDFTWKSYILILYHFIWNVHRQPCVKPYLT